MQTKTSNIIVENEDGKETSVRQKRFSFKAGKITVATVISIHDPDEESARLGDQIAGIIKSAIAKAEHPNQEELDLSKDGQESGRVEADPILDAVLTAIETNNPFVNTSRIMTDDEIRRAIAASWREPIHGVNIHGQCFVAIGARGKNKEPQIYVAGAPQIPANVNGKPTLSGSKMIAAIRKLRGIQKPEKSKSKK